MPHISFFFSLLIALTFACYNMHEGWPFEIFNCSKAINKRFHIMTIYWTNITKSKVFKQSTRNEYSFNGFIDFVGVTGNFFSNTWNSKKKLADLLLDF